MVKQILGFAQSTGAKLANIDFFNLFAKKTQKIYLYQIKPFRENENWLAHWQWFLSNFYSMTDQLSFFIIWNSKEIKLYAKVPDIFKNYFESTFYASFPTSDLISVSDLNIDVTWNFLHFDNPTFLTDADFKKDWVYLDPMKDLVSLFHNMSYMHGDVWLVFNYKFKVNKSLIRKVFDYTKSKPAAPQPTDNNKVDFKSHVVAFSVWFQVNCTDQIIASSIKNDLKSAFAKFLKWWRLSIKPVPKFIPIWIESVVNFFHIPTKDNFIKNLNYLTFRKLPLPPILPTRTNTEQNWLTLLWDTDYKNEQIRFGIKNEDKFRHMYIIWKTWMGKSTLMSNMLLSDMYTNKWIALIDPHWDLVETVLEHVPAWRTNDIILFDVADTSFPIGFNILHYDNEEQKNLVSSGIVWIFKKLYGHSWWPRLEYILRNVILSVLEYPDATLLHMNRMLTDKNFRMEVLEYVKDPIILKFWQDEFNKWQDKQLQEAIWPIVNKIWQFLSSTIVRNIFWQPRSRLNIRQIMDEWKILLINLSKWRIWDDNAEMIGSFFVTKFQIDAMSRADIAYEKDRKPFFLYIDEFQNFATESFTSILSEARKYKLSLIVANQYISQLDDSIKNAIFGNVGTIISFALWHDDAWVISSQFKGMITANDLLSLQKFRAYVKLMIDGMNSDPFCMSTYPLPTPSIAQETKDKIRKQSRQRYATEKQKLEWLIKLWAEKRFSMVDKVVDLAKNNNNPVASSTSTDNSKWETKPSSFAVETPESGFSIDKVVIWTWYNWLVKLKYNYWLFVTVNWVEWLLHKNFLKVPVWVRWKDLYEIWSKIQVKASEIKEVNWEKRVVWVQI